jgi:hypothetical protein
MRFFDLTINNKDQSLSKQVLDVCLKTGRDKEFLELFVVASGIQNEVKI